MVDIVSATKKFTDAIIIDDENDICEVCKMYLENLDIYRNIVVATDGIHASSKLNNQSFALILLDLNMPKKGGMDILRQLSSMANNRFENVIVMSGEIDKAVIQEAMKAGVKHFMVKPFDQASFEAKIKVFAKGSKK